MAFVGEAAGLVDPLFGEGIYYAAKSAVLASRCVFEAAGRGEDLTDTVHS